MTIGQNKDYSRLLKLAKRHITCPLHDSDTLAQALIDALEVIKAAERLDMRHVVLEDFNKKWSEEMLSVVSTKGESR